MARPAAIELAPGVVRIPTVGSANVNSFAVVDDDGSVTLVDCGLKRAPARIVAGLRAVGRHPGDVRRIVLTHAHTDHAGQLHDRVAGGNDGSGNIIRPWPSARTSPTSELRVDTVKL